MNDTVQDRLKKLEDKDPKNICMVWFDKDGKVLSSELMLYANPNEVVRRINYRFVDIPDVMKVHIVFCDNAHVSMGRGDDVLSAMEYIYK